MDTCKVKSKLSQIGYVMLVLVLLSSGLVGFTSKTYAADEFDQLREKHRMMLIGGANLSTTDPDIANAIIRLTTTANRYWQSMNKTSNRTYLWQDNSGVGNSAQIRTTYERLKTMALAYSTVGSSVYGDTTLQSDIVSALDYMYSTRYNENVTTTPSGTSNWWDWQIGIPLQLNDAVVLMYDHLNSTQITNYMNAVERFSPTVTSTGANRAWKAMVVAVRGVIVKDSAKIANARDGLSAIFKYVTSGDGFYTDGSFIQHANIPYTGGYGIDLLKSLSDLMVLLQGSTWQVTDPLQANVWDWITNAYQPLMYKGAIMDMVRGREISRYYQQDHVAGHAVIGNILLLAEIAPTAQANDVRRMIKGWITSDTYASYYADASIPSIVRAKAIMNNSAITPAANLMLYKQFSAMDRAVQQRGTYSWGLAMYSNRIASYEAINSENGKAWYTSTGMTSLYNNDLAQYSEDYWPTVDAYRLAGTTVLSQQPATTHKSVNTWTGGTDSNKQYGVSGMDLKYSDHALTAKKSWFMFDDEMVALGADITSTDNVAVETIVENRKLNAQGNNAFTVNGQVYSSTLGWSDTLSQVKWAHLGSSISGASIGYYFPNATTVQAKREARTGNWKQINTRPGSPATPITRNYMTMWINQGTNPSGANYEYVVLPGKTAIQVSSYAAQPDVTILANSATIQAVKENTLNLIGANFWTDSIQTIAGVTVNKKASVMVQEKSNKLYVSVSDPTQSNTGTITVELDKVATKSTVDAGITVNQLSPTIKFSVNVNAAKGKTFKAIFDLQ